MELVSKSQILSFHRIDYEYYRKYQKRYKNVNREKQYNPLSGSEALMLKHDKYVVGVTLSLLMIGLISSSSSAFGAAPESGFLNSKNCTPHFPSGQATGTVTCCWNDGGGQTCQTCNWVQNTGYTTCEPSEFILNEQPPTRQPSGPAAPLQEGVLEQTETPTAQTPGQSILPGNEGLLEQPEEEEKSNNDNIENNPLDMGVLKE